MLVLKTSKIQQNFHNDRVINFYAGLGALPLPVLERVHKKLKQMMIQDLEMANPKASFDEYYTLYSPNLYADILVKKLNYRLPFDAIHIGYSVVSVLNY